MDYVDNVENYIVENHTKDFGHRIPAQYNIATFSNGNFNILNNTTSNKLSSPSLVEGLSNNLPRSTSTGYL